MFDAHRQSYRAPLLLIMALTLTSLSAGCGAESSAEASADATQAREQLDLSEGEDLGEARQTRDAHSDDALNDTHTEPEPTPDTTSDDDLIEGVDDASVATDIIAQDAETLEPPDEADVSESDDASEVTLPTDAAPIEEVTEDTSGVEPPDSDASSEDSDSEGPEGDIAPEDAMDTQDSASPEDAMDTQDSASPEEDMVEESCPACGPSGVQASFELAQEALTPDLERTRHNPLKGFITSYAWSAPANALPDQMEFLYLPMSQVWNASGETFDAGLEPYLEAAQERSHHVVLRVFIDYPNKPSGLPSYLTDIVPCTPYSDHGGGCSPDYDHPALTEAMLGLIQALGARYDADPRLGVIQLGLLGFWGEWHTWPYPDWFPSLETQEAILTAYDQAFQVTELQARRAAANAVSLRIGYHDDSFAYSTLGDIGWFFWPGLISAGADERYKEVMMGGELRPELQATIFEESYQLSTYAQDFDLCVQTTHASYMLNYQGFSGEGTGYQGAELEQAEASALAMGYTFELTQAALKLSGLDEAGVDATLELTLSQTGVAPFYYPLALAVALEGVEEMTWSDEDLSTLLPGESRTLSVALGHLPHAAIDAPFTLHLLSDMLLEGQIVRLGTQTPWSSEEGPTRLQWSLGCESEVGPLTLGETLELEGEACPCVCEVDGTLRTCDGSPCP